MASSFRGRNFAFLIYPQSCALSYKDMLKKLSKLGVSCAVSPLHRPDEDEGVKKEHYHVLMQFDGVKSLEALDNLVDMDTGSMFDWRKICNCYGISKNDIPHFIIVNSICGYYRYLIHKDNPEKQQFEGLIVSSGYEGLEDENKINTLVLLNGFNSRDYLDRDKKLSEDVQLVQIMTENNLCTPRDLIFYLTINNHTHLLDYIHKNLYFVRTFLFSNEGQRIVKDLDKLKKKKEIKQKTLDIY